LKEKATLDQSRQERKKRYQKKKAKRISCQGETNSQQTERVRQFSSKDEQRKDGDFQKTISIQKAVRSPASKEMLEIVNSSKGILRRDRVRSRENGKKRMPISGGIAITTEEKSTGQALLVTKEGRGGKEERGEGRTTITHSLLQRKKLGEDSYYSTVGRSLYRLPHKKKPE